MAVKGDIVLKDQDRSKLDSIVTKMVNNKESDESIKAVVTDFKSKYGQKGTTAPSASQLSVKKTNTAAPTPEDIMSIKTAIGVGGDKPTQAEIQQSLKKEKPVTTAPSHQKQQDDTPEHIDEEARTKLDEIMYADDSRWKDPLRSVYESYFNANDKEKAVINRAATLTQRSLAPDGFEAKKILQSTHLGKEGDDNMTARELRSVAQDYDKTTAPLREIKLTPEDYDQNENAKKTYAYQIQNAAIKWWADKNPDFKRQLGGKNIDINDPDLSNRIGDSGQVGMILNEYLNDGHVRTYVDKENPHMLPAAEYADKNNITTNKQWGVNKVANEVSREIQKSGYNKSEPIFNYWGKGSQEYANLTAQTMYANDPVKMDIYNKIIKDNQSEYLDAPSFFEGVAEQGKSFFEGIGHTITTPFRSRGKDIQDEWRKEASNVSADPDGYIRLIRDAGRATGFVLPLMAGGEVLQGAKLITNPMNAQKVLVGLSLFGDELRKQEMKFSSPVKAWSAALLNTGGFVMLNNIFPAAKARAAFNEVSPELSAIMENLTAGKITKEVARQQANTTFKKAIDFGTKFMAQNTKTSLEMTALADGSKIVDKILGLDDKTFDKYHPKDEEIETFNSMFLSNSVVAGLSAWGELNKRNHALENSWWEVANKSKTYMRIADETAAKNPAISRSELYDNIKFLHETKKLLDQDGVPSTKQKEYLAAAMKERVMRANVDKIPDETMRKSQESNIKIQQTIKEHILKGEPVPDELYTQLKPGETTTSARINTEGDNKKFEPAQGRATTDGRNRPGTEGEVTRELTPTIVVGGNEYTGKDHGEAMDKARAAGETIPDKDTPEGKQWRFENGQFKEKDGKLISRDQAQEKYGINKSEDLDERGSPKQASLRDVEGTTKALNELQPAELNALKNKVRNALSGGESLSSDQILPEKIADYYHKVKDDKNNPIVKAVEDLLGKPPEPSEKETAREPIDIGKQTQDVLTQMNNAELINEKTISAAEDHLYDMLEKHPEASHLIEPLIQKIQNYEFTTKTETRTTTEKVPTGRTAKTKIEIKPILGQSVGSPVTIKTPDGTAATGTLNVKSGQYVVDVPGGTQRVIGEKALTDNTLSLPSEQEMHNPISFDKDGNVESVTVKDKSGNLITINDPEKALDIAIQLQAEMLGEIPDAAFQEIYDEVQKEIPEEVLKNQEKKPDVKTKDQVPVAAEGKGTPDTETNKAGQAAEKTPGDPTRPPEGPREVAGSPKQEWAAIRKEKMEEIASVKDLYEKQSGKKWTEVEEKAMGDLQAEYPDKNLYEAARDKVYKMADLFDKGGDFNPSTAELAQIKYFLAETKQRRANIGDWASEDDITRLRALDDWKKTNDDLLAIGKALNPSEAGRAFGYRQSESMLDPENGLTTRRMELMGAKGGERLSDEEMK
jgi:hypothetical protein